MSDIKVNYEDHMGDDLAVVNAATITAKYIREAYQRGYRVTDDGILWGVNGPRKISIYGSQRYPTFSIHVEGRVFGIPIHQFAAYCFYGEEVFRSDLCVRHLNSDVLDVSRPNILLGTPSQNSHDKPEEVRKEVAKAARAAQGHTPKNAKLTPQDVREIREEYAKLGGKKAPNGYTTKMADRYGVSRQVIHKTVTKEYYANV